MMATATETDARPELTDRQKRVLAAVVRLTGERGFPPSIRELTDDLGFASTNSVVVHLTALTKKGYVETKTQYRGGLGCPTARCVVVPELKAALAAAALSYLDGLGPLEGGA